MLDRRSHADVLALLAMVMGLVLASGCQERAQAQTAEPMGPAQGAGPLEQSEDLPDADAQVPTEEAVETNSPLREEQPRLDEPTLGEDDVDAPRQEEPVDEAIDKDAVDDDEPKLKVPSKAGEDSPPDFIDVSEPKMV